MNASDIPDGVAVRLTSEAPEAWGDECVPWFLSVGSHGYGQIGLKVGNRKQCLLAHRVSYVIFKGEIPDDMTVDHICRNRRCWNPNHLRLLTNTDNARDNGQGSKTHCPSGHAYSGDNLYISPRGHRYCRLCARRHRQNSINKSKETSNAR